MSGEVQGLPKLLFIDDEAGRWEAFKAWIVNKNWDADLYWACTYESALECLNEGYFNGIFLDNDLGSEGEGRHILNLIEESTYTDDKYEPPQLIAIHTANPVARQSMVHTALKIKEKHKGVIVDVFSFDQHRQ